MTLKRPPGRMTADEYEAWLRNTGQYEARAARLQQQEEEREKRRAAWRQAETSLVKELQAAGYGVNSVWDLVNTSASYVSALPILLRHLALTYPAPVREGIARALAVPEAKFGWQELTRLFMQETEERAKDGLAVAIAATADDQTLPQLIELLRDPRHGTSRVLLLTALERSTHPNALETLSDLQTDPDLAKEIRVILRLKRRRRR